MVARGGGALVAGWRAPLIGIPVVPLTLAGFSGGGFVVRKFEGWLWLFMEMAIILKYFQEILVMNFIIDFSASSTKILLNNQSKNQYHN